MSDILFACPVALNLLSGTPIRALLTITEVAKRANSVTVISFVEGAWGENVRIKKLPYGLRRIETMYYFFLFFAFPFVLYHLIYERPRVIHAFGSSWIIPILTYKMWHRNVKVLIELHGISEFEQQQARWFLIPLRYLFIWFDKLAVKRADRVLSMSAAQKQFLVTKYGASEDKTFVSWGPVDVDLFKCGEPQKRNKFIVCYSGNDNFWQGLDIVFSACKLLGKRADISFKFIGFSPSKYRQLQLRNATFLGKLDREKTAKELCQCDLFLSPRLVSKVADTQYPFKLSAYLSAGRPVVVSDVGDQGYIVKEARCGIVLSRRDPEELVRAILEIKDMSDNQRTEMGLRARQFAEANLSLDVFGRIYEGL